MVDYNTRIDAVFIALSDSTRRDILHRVADQPLTVNQIALDYDMSVAAVSKHLKVLEVAGLITKRKSGRYVFIHSYPLGLSEVNEVLQQYQQTNNKQD